MKKIKTRINKRAVPKKKITLLRSNLKNKKLKKPRQIRNLRRNSKETIGRMLQNLELIKPPRKIRILVALLKTLIKEMTLRKKLKLRLHRQLLLDRKILRLPRTKKIKRLQQMKVQLICSQKLVQVRLPLKEKRVRLLDSLK